MSDNKIIRTTILDVAPNLTGGTYYIVQKASGTYKISWASLVAVLSGSVATYIVTTPPPTT